MREKLWLFAIFLAGCFAAEWPTMPVASDEEDARSAVVATSDTVAWNGDCILLADHSMGRP